MKRIAVIFITGSLLALSGFSTLAQQVKISTGKHYQAACNNSFQFTLNKNKLFKSELTVYLKTKKGTMTFRDSLVEEEHPDMKMYEPVGFDENIGKALIKVTGLVDTKFILVDIKSERIDRLNSNPMISKDCKYLVSVSAPESDSYEGLQLYQLLKNDLRLIFSDTKPDYQYVNESGKWCNDKFFVLRKNNFTRENEYVQISF
jgi:hypothetical protein